MKYLGIDYGEKNVGIAISDEEGVFAFAKTILQNDKQLLKKIAKLCQQEKIDAIVLGESKNLDGQDNLIQKKILLFKEGLEKNYNFLVYLEPEFMTSREAERLQEGVDKIDASAAALILKSYLDKQNQKK